MFSRLGKSSLAALAAAAPPELRAAVRAGRRELRLRRRLPSLAANIAEAQRFSMVPEDWMRALATQTVDLFESGIPGSIVECGCWQGGIGILLGRVLDSLKDDRRVFLCDSFEGLPPPDPIDGKAARAWALDRSGADYHDNCRAAVGAVRKTLEAHGLSKRVILIEGWFNESLPRARTVVGPIALLRIDADWYSSVSTCLEELYDAVVANGYVVFDDYDTWDGCATAVHEFLGRRKLSHRILHDGCAYFRKT